jgi:hypothetical protein
MSFFGLNKKVKVWLGAAFSWEVWRKPLELLFFHSGLY